jgi:hypothetical protein
MTRSLWAMMSRSVLSALLQISSPPGGAKRFLVIEGEEFKQIQMLNLCRSAEALPRG